MTPDEVQLPGFPRLRWTHGAGDHEVSVDDGASVLTLRARPGVDWSNSSSEADLVIATDATALVFAAPAQFRLSARVRVLGGRTTYDAGALVVWADERHWAKLCFEQSPQGQPMVVSVVTNTWSDDVNSSDVDDQAVHLRVSTHGSALTFHCSSDGRLWRFVRQFRLQTWQPLLIGFMSQAPLGQECVARFDRLEFTAEPLADPRDQS